MRSQASSSDTRGYTSPWLVYHQSIYVLLSKVMCLPSMLLLIMLQAGMPGLSNSNNISIVDGGLNKPYPRTTFDAGPTVGDILNWHFFPALSAYNSGQYRSAIADLNYIIQR